MTDAAPQKNEPQTVKKTISLPAELDAQAAKRARAEQRTFSSYVQSLIAKDLREEAPQQ